MTLKRLPFSFNFIFGNRKKSQGALITSDDPGQGFIIRGELMKFSADITFSDPSLKSPQVTYTTANKRM
jgi:hypothetical protein